MHKERQGPVRLEIWSPPRYAATLGTWGRYCARFPGLILPFFLPTEIRFVGGSNVLNEQNYIFQPPLKKWGSHGTKFQQIHWKQKG